MVTLLVMLETREGVSGSGEYSVVDVFDDKAYRCFVQND